MADEVVCGRGVDIDYDGCDVSSVAGKAEGWSLVSQYGFRWINWSVLRNGHLPPDTILCDCLYGTARTMAVSEPIRGCRFL